MAAPRRGSTIATLTCLTTLAVAEYGTITYAVLPLPSTRDDWLLATLGIAPALAYALLWTVALTIRVIDDTVTILKRTYHWIAGSHK